MAAYANDFILRVAEELLDTDFDRWTIGDHLSNLNAGERQIVYFKPTAYTVATTFQLVAGSRQTLPTGTIEFVRINRYRGLAGTTDGAEILPATSKDMDELVPGWRTTTAAAQPIHYVFNEQDRTHFDVYPAQPSSNMGYVEAICSKVPPFVLPVDGDWNNTTFPTNFISAINLGDEYAEPLVNYMLFAAYARNAASSAYDAERAVAHWNLFLSQIGRKDLIEKQYPMRRPDKYGNTTQSVS